jgi:hypothetical protein
MNNTYYKAELAYMKPEEGSGEEKLVKETYLFAAVSYTDAEVKVHEAAAEIIPSGKSFTVNKIDKLSLGALVVNNEQAYYLAKLAYTMDTDKGVKTVKTQVLVPAGDVKVAAQLAYDEFAMANPEVLSVAKTPILEVFDGK